MIKEVNLHKERREKESERGDKYEFTQHVQREKVIAREKRERERERKEGRKKERKKEG